MKQAIINIINTSIENPAFLIDAGFSLIECNESGRKIISKFDLINESTQKLFEEYRGFRDKVGKISDDNPHTFELDLKVDDKKYKYSLSVQNILKVPEPLNLIVLKENDGESKSKYKFNVITDQIESHLNTEEMQKIISKVRSAYPFTFIGKQKFQRDIDKLESEFFIREAEGKFVVANRVFADNINEKTNLVTGKKINELLSANESEIIKSSDNFILQTKKPIIFSVSSSAGNIDYLSTPLIDLDENIIAIITISIGALETGKSKGSDYENYLLELNEPVLILNDEKEYIFANKKYKSLFASDESAQLEDHIKLLPEELENVLASFIQDAELKNLLNDKTISSNEGNDYKFYFRKIKFGDDQEVIVIEPLLNDLFNQQNELKVKMYDIIMHTSPEPMFIYDIENLKFLEVNHAALKMYGYTRDDFLEMDLTDLYAPEDIQTLIESSPNKTISSDFTGPWRHKHKNGSSILVELSKSTLEFDGKRAHFNIVRDVTQFLEDQKKLQQYKAAYENTSDLIVSTDEDGFITSSNNNFLAQLGYEKEDVKQKPMLSLVADADRARLNSEIFHSGIKTKISFSTKLKTADKKELAVKLIADPILNYDDVIKGYNLTCLLQSEKPVAVETAKSTTSTNILDQSFLSNLFHDILTPINVITGFVQELSESIETPSAEQAESISYIKDNQQLLLQIMDNAVEYSNLEQDNVEIIPEPIVFVELLEELENGIEKTAKSKNVSFTYGKISSSLKFNSDKQKFNTFISLFSRFAIASTNQSKLYLSAYQNTSDKFIVCLRDERTALTNEFLKNMDDILTIDESIIKQKFGISRFAIRLAKKLIVLLNAKKIILKQDNINSEYAFEFPMTLDVIKKTDTEVIKSKEQKEPEIVIEDSPETKVKVDYKPAPESLENTADVVTQTHHVEEMVLTEPVPALNDSQTQSINVNVNLQTPAKEKQDEPKVEIIGEPDEETTQAAAKPASTQIVKNMKELSCLYVEDQVDSQILFKVQMKDLKSIDFATSFEKALPLMQLKQFDFMVMDINLQGEYNGLDALRAIQKMPGLSEIPIIAVTAYVLPGDREKFIAAGFTDFITKPILRDKLDNVLKKIFVDA